MKFDFASRPHDAAESVLAHFLVAPELLAWISFLSCQPVRSTDVCLFFACVCVSLQVAVFLSPDFTNCCSVALVFAASLLQASSQFRVSYEIGAASPGRVKCSLCAFSLATLSAVNVTQSLTPVELPTRLWSEWLGQDAGGQLIIAGVALGDRTIAKAMCRVVLRVGTDNGEDHHAIKVNETN